MEFKPIGTGGQTMQLIDKFSESIKVLNDYKNHYCSYGAKMDEEQGCET